MATRRGRPTPKSQVKSRKLLRNRQDTAGSESYMSAEHEPKHPDSLDQRLIGEINCDIATLGEVRPETLLRFAFKRVGFNTDVDPSTQNTPRRFIKYLMEYLNRFDPMAVLGDGFKGPEDHGIHGIVAQCNIPFRMICEHHLLPAFGLAHVGYIPRHKVVGLSKLARLVEGFGTQQPSMQELIGEKIADALHKGLDSNGSIVLIEAEHTCMSCRGVTAPGVITSTQVIRGVFRDVPAAREEFAQLVASAKGKGSNR